MCKILSRIKILAENEGISLSTLEKTIGASRGVISRAIAKGTDIQSKWLELICKHYPHYSAQWLLSGTGDMYVTEDSNRGVEQGVREISHDAIISPSVPDTVSTLLSMVQSKDQEIGALRETIGRLKAQLEILSRSPKGPDRKSVV